MIEKIEKETIPVIAGITSRSDKVIKFNPYTCGKRFFISLGNTPALERKSRELINTVVEALNELKLDFSALTSTYYIVRFAKYTDIEEVTDAVKKALRAKFKGGRLRKVSIKNLCVVFPNNNFFTIDIMNGRKS